MKNYGVKKLPSEADLDRMLSKTKIRLLRQKGAVFLSTIMGQMEYSWDESIPTAATNGVKILWNPYFFASLDEDLAAPKPNAPTLFNAMFRCTSWS